MKYRLIVITHGGDETTEMLKTTLAAFQEMVSPSPCERFLIEDGPRKEKLDWRGTRFWSEKPMGFCVTAARAWEVAAHPGVPLVYWMEHDFIHTRPVYLRHMAEVLRQEEMLAQMSLMRQAVNPQEVKAGGVVARDPDAFVPRLGRASSFGDPAMPWLEHGRYWTTNPSLFRADLAREEEWPSVKEGCEGHHSISLREQGYSFGIWGEGEPWVEHIGERSGFGY